MNRIQTIILLFFLTICNGLYATKIINLEARLNPGEESVFQVDILNAISNKYIMVDFEQSEFWAKKAYLMAKKIDYKEGVVTAMGNQAYVFIKRGELAQCEDIIEQMELLSIEANYGLGLIDASNMKGHVAACYSEFDRAIEQYYNSVELADSFGEHQIKPEIYNNIALVFADLKAYSKAIQQLRRVLYASKETNDTLNEFYSYCNIASMYDELDSLDLAQSMYDTATILILKYDLEIDRTVWNNNLGILNQKRGDYDKAYMYLRASLEASIKMEEVYGRAEIYNSFAHFFFDTKNYDSAHWYLDTSNAVCRRIGQYTLVLDNKELRSKIYESQGDFKESINVMNEYYHLKDSIAGQAMLERIGRYEAKHEFQVAKQELVRMKEKNQFQIIVAGLLSLVLISIIVSLYLIVTKNRVKENLVQDQNENLEMENELLKARDKHQLREKERLEQELDFKDQLNEAQEMKIEAELKLKESEMLAIEEQGRKKNELFGQLTAALIALRDQNELDDSKLLDALISELEEGIE